MAAAIASQISFSFFAMVLMLGSFILQWWAATAADLNLWCTPSDSTFSCDIMTLLLGRTSLVALRTGSTVLFKVYSTALNTMKNT